MRRPSNDSAPTKASSPGEIANSLLCGTDPARPGARLTAGSSPGLVAGSGLGSRSGLAVRPGRSGRLAALDLALEPGRLVGGDEADRPRVLEPPAVSRSTAATPSARWITLRLTSTFWIRR